MTHGPIIHPLDKLINNETLFMLEALIPFVDKRLKTPLAVYIKMMELQIIIKSLSNYDYVDKCGFNMDMNNQEQVLSALAGCGFSDITQQFEGIKKAMNMANMMNMMNEFNEQENSYNASYDSPHEAPDDNVTKEEETYNNDNDTPYTGDMMENIMDLLNQYDNMN